MNITTKRNLVLWSVNILVLIHILLWHRFRAWGLGTISPQGGLDIFVDGVLTGSAIFTAVLVVLTIACGRVACGWGCHFAAFQETSAALLKKLQIPVQPVHSRASVVRYLFLALLLYAPVRSLATKGLPSFHELGLSHVEVFTPDLPTGWVLVATLLISALLLTALLGSRPFCRYVCPWALVFRFLDRVSPTRIRQQKDCAECRICSDNCPMGIDVAAEIKAHGQVKSTECVRCLTCTRGCPNGALAYSPKRTPFPGTGIPIRVPSNFGWAVDLSLVAVAVGLSFLFNQRLDNFQGWLGAAWGLALGLCALRAFTAVGTKSQLLAAAGATVLAGGLVWIIITPTQVHTWKSGRALVARGDVATAGQLFRQALAAAPESSRSFDIRGDLARALEHQGRWDEALALYQEMLVQKPYYAARTHYRMGLAYLKQGRHGEGVEHFRLAVEGRPGWAEAHWNLAACLKQLGRDDEARAELATALRLDPSLADRVR